MKKVRDFLWRTMIGIDRDSIRGMLEAAVIAKGQDQTFERAYGRFMIAWADAEAQLYRVLCHYAEVTDAVARAIFSGTRANTMMDFIDAIAHNTKMAKARVVDLDYVFPQMSAINKMRDHLAHYASHDYGITADDPMSRLVTNAGRVARYGKEKMLALSVETLEAMTQDLSTITNHLYQHRNAGLGGFRPWREKDSPDQPKPWRYKSPQPETSRRRSPSIRHKREDPPK